MNYYKIKNAALEADGVDTYAHFTDGSVTVVSDMDVRRAVGFDMSPETIQQRYAIKPLTKRQLTNVKSDSKFSLNQK